MKALLLSFIPTSPNFALLVLRVWLGLTMILQHGLKKVDLLDKTPIAFPSFLGLDPKISLYLAIGSEVVAAGLLVIGLFTRLSALALITAMAFAFWGVHQGYVSGNGPAGSGELAFIYLAGFVTIFLSGPGNLSADSKLGR